MSRRQLVYALNELNLSEGERRATSGFVENRHHGRNKINPAVYQEHLIPQMQIQNLALPG